MADKTIGELTRATSLDDDSLLIAEQQGEAVSLPGSLFKQFVEDAVDEQVGAAEQYAKDAADSAQEAQDAVSRIGTAVEDTKENAEAAVKAREAIENMIVEAVTLASGDPATVTKDIVDDVVRLVFGLPAGAKGDKGDPGNSIQSITRTTGNGAPGTVDTYTITLTDGSTSAFNVYNGADGNGAGDMTASVYDPQGKKTDIFKAIDDAAAAIPNVPDWALQNTKPTYTASEVGADASGAAASALTDAKAYTDGKVINRNLLDNWYFADPVNQRGLTEYVGVGYGIDRWANRNNNAVHEITEDGIKIYMPTISTTSFARIQQPIANSEQYAGKTLTFSVLLGESTVERGTLLFIYTVDGASQNQYVNYSKADKLVTFTATLPVGTTDLYAVISGTDGRYGDTAETYSLIVAAKLELGSVQTLAHQDADGNWVLNEIPDYGEELAKCQRYYQIFSSEEARPAALADYRPSMRTTPATGTVEIDGVTYYYADANL